MNFEKIKDYLFLHISLFIYSIGAIFAKIAGTNETASFNFVFFYGLFLMVLFIYALLWQQILKKFPLTIAFANKAVVILWGVLWGLLFFDEVFRWGMLFGAVIIIGGIYLVVSDDK